MNRENSITTLVKFLALLISEIITIDKNKDGNISAMEVLGATLTTLAQAQAVAGAFNFVKEDFDKIRNILDVDGDEFDLLVDEIAGLDFLPDDKHAIETAVKKTLITIVYAYDTAHAWIDTGAGDKPNVVTNPSPDVATALKIAPA